jgi:hypothetical protein
LEECANITKSGEKVVCEAKRVDRRHELLDSPTQKDCVDKAKTAEEHKLCTMEYVPKIQAGGSVYGSKYIRYNAHDMVCDR